MYVKKRGEITNSEYQGICNTSNKTAKRYLSKLVSKKVLTRIGITGKGTVYVLRKHHKCVKDVIKTPK